MGGGFSSSSSRRSAPPPPRPVYHRHIYGIPRRTTVIHTSETPETVKARAKYSLIIWLCVFAGIMFMIFLAGRIGNGMNSRGSTVKSTIKREPIESGNAYINDCVVDELGWINNESKLSSRLKDFWEKTGVQPYIYLKAYDPELKSDAQKDQWAADWDRENITTENVFLYVYFAEKDEDDVGYMVYRNGLLTSSVMDAEAVDIFWNYLDNYWYSWDADDTDGMFVEIFNRTADTIMREPTNAWDAVRPLIIGLVIIGVIVAVIILIRTKRAAEAARAAETERILNTPMQDLINESENNGGPGT